ncbi:hypothetical protein FORC087_440 (plasmid) [Bacillus cereus]|nr:hypothetical protein FORC087_440 [Bacillus cereus]
MMQLSMYRIFGKIYHDDFLKRTYIERRDLYISNINSG